jgi:hypothetical protein
MNRRTLVGALGSAVALSGCLESVRPKRVSHSYEVFYYLTERSVIEGGIDIDEKGEKRRRLFAFTSAETAKAKFDVEYLETLGESDVVEFIENTDFGPEMLVVYQQFPVASAPERTVIRSRWDDGTVRLVLGKSGLSNADPAIETVLVRVGLHGYPFPDAVEVTDAANWTVRTTVA